jgi:hypothetical protein
LTHTVDKKLEENLGKKSEKSRESMDSLKFLKNLKNNFLDYVCTIHDRDVET